MALEHASIDVREIDLNDAGKRSDPIDARPYAIATIQGVHQSGTWGTSVVTVQQSNDGVNWQNLESSTTVPVGGGYATNTSGERIIDVSSVSWIILKVTTAEGAAGTADFHVVLKAEG